MRAVWAASAAAAVVITPLLAWQANGATKPNVEAEDWRNGTAWCVESDYHRAYGCLKADGDWIQIGDARADGKRVAVRWTSSTGEKGTCVSDHGHDELEVMGTALYQGIWACNEEIEENSRVRLKAGFCDGDTRRCASLKDWRWGPAEVFRND